MTATEEAVPVQNGYPCVGTERTLAIGNGNDDLSA
jgi:hypothetical protein